jgi:hypothetical protein
MLCCVLAAPDLRDISSVPPDLATPPMTAGTPAPGKRVKQVAPEYQGTEVYHALYLPTDWRPGQRYPVLVDYAGNGNYRNGYGDVSTGRVEGSNLGYGISAGKGFIWVCMPYVNAKEKKNEIRWWGDVEATVTYCRKTVRRVCEEYGGDPSAVIMTGFSRGAIGCGYLGLHDDKTADIWLAFLAYANFDGLSEKWGYAEVDGASAQRRLKRLGGRALLVATEQDANQQNTYLCEARQYFEASGVLAPITYQTSTFRNHNDAWTLRPSVARDDIHKWLRDVLDGRPGTHAIRGRVTGPDGRGMAGVRIESGYTHFTFTDALGHYELRGLIDSSRTVEAIADGRTFAPTQRSVLTAGKDVEEVDFVETN